MKWVWMWSCAVMSVWGCIVVDQWCRGSNGKKGIWAYLMRRLTNSLNDNNINHIWLIQYLFLQIINSQLTFWASSWNQHKLQIQSGPTPSPVDLFIFNMLVHNVQGDQLPDKELSEEELEVYGVDWQGLCDEQLLWAQKQNNPGYEEGSSWVGWNGPPPPAHLNEVTMEPLTGHLMEQEILALEHGIEHWYQFSDDASRRNIGAQGLGVARVMQGNIF